MHLHSMMQKSMLHIPAQNINPSAVAITLDPHLKEKMTTTIVHHNEGTGVRYPPEESIPQQKHIRAKSSFQKLVLCRISFHHSGSHTNFTRFRAHGQQMYVIQIDPYHKDAHSHIPDRPNNRY